MAGKTKQIQLSEVERLKLENIELKKRAVEQQYNTLEAEAIAIIENLCKANNCKAENVESINIDSGIVSLK